MQGTLYERLVLLPSLAVKFKAIAVLTKLSTEGDATTHRLLNRALGANAALIAELDKLATSFTTVGVAARLQQHNVPSLHWTARPELHT